MWEDLEAYYHHHNFHLKFEEFKLRIEKGVIFFYMLQCHLMSHSSTILNQFENHQWPNMSHSLRNMKRKKKQQSQKNMSMNLPLPLINGLNLVLMII